VVGCVTVSELVRVALPDHELLSRTRYIRVGDRRMHILGHPMVDRGRDTEIAGSFHRSKRHAR
jgi:hypothetical protein